MSTGGSRAGRVSKTGVVKRALHLRSTFPAQPSLACRLRANNCIPFVDTCVQHEMLGACLVDCVS